MTKSGQETGRGWHMEGKAEEPAGACDTLGRLSGAGAGAARQAWGSSEAGAGSPRAS